MMIQKYNPITGKSIPVASNNYAALYEHYSRLAHMATLDGDKKYAARHELIADYYRYFVERDSPNTPKLKASETSHA